MENEADLDKHILTSNSIGNQIKFTMGKENIGGFPFLDILIGRHITFFFFSKL